jgi:hypothetical protein
VNAQHKKAVIKRIADLGRPGSAGHIVELEVAMPRRQAFRILVPFLVTLMIPALNQPENRR